MWPTRSTQIAAYNTNLHECSDKLTLRTQTNQFAAVRFFGKGFRVNGRGPDPEGDKSGRGRWPCAPASDGPFRCGFGSVSPERCSGATGEGPDPGANRRQRLAAEELGPKTTPPRLQDPSRELRRLFFSAYFFYHFWNVLWKPFSDDLGCFGVGFGGPCQGQKW